jgi:hypothetical protein
MNIGNRFAVVMAILLLALQGCAGSRVSTKINAKETVATSAWCLTRRHPDHTDSINTFYMPDKSAWSTTVTGTIHQDHNEVSECRDPESHCNLKKRDKFLIERKEFSTRTFSYKRNPSASPAVDSNGYVDLELKRGLFLSGKIKKSANETADIYVLFSGVVYCGSIPDTGPWRADDRCKLYTIEIYPSDVDGWDDYKPDSDSVIWARGECGGLVTRPRQPGGGDGHDPP